ncbi:MAG: FtsX-like permease family protein, partial [bacterium]|nr:FtsX-like permease family protein [bacterium]
VFERTGEIGTYTALGIAPSHIGRLFLVEAGVFAILGTMAGYVLGQSVSWCVHELDVPMLSALDLNYSSLAGVGACVLVIMMTLASAYYPSRKATEIGVPDIERRWRLPKTKEPRITLDLPFTVSLLEAQGLVAYLKEYLDSHVDVSVGSFYVEGIEAGPNVVDNQGTGVTGQFWLTPFDLGVSQRTTFVLRILEGMDVCGVQVRLERLSGDAGSWRRANGHFMTDMRSQFLMWRNLTPDVRMDYVERGKEYALV